MTLPVPKSIPDIIFGYGANYVDTLNFKGFFWDNATNFFYTVTPTNQFNIFLNVPQSQAMGMLVSNDQDSYYANTICGGYDACLLTENCTQLITDTGAYLVI